MKIETNMTKKDRIHDVIKYLPIERQVYDLFKAQAKVGYEIESGIIIKINGLEHTVEIGTKAVKLSGLRSYEPGVPNFHGQYPTLTLPYNTDVEDRCAEFLTLVDKVVDLHDKAKEQIRKFPPVKEIEKFLKQELGGDGLTVSFWNSFTEVGGTELAFHVHPEGSAPAQGVMLCFEHDSHKIAPYWNGSTVRRKQHYGPVETIEKAAGNHGNTLAELKKHIEVVENLKKRIAAFRVSDGALSKALEVNAQLRTLFLAFQELKVKKKKSKR